MRTVSMWYDLAVMNVESGNHGMSNPNWWEQQMAQPLKGDTTEWKVPLKERISRALEGVLQKPGFHQIVTLFEAITDSST
jgi:hypothetical protein